MGDLPVLPCTERSQDPECHSPPQGLREDCLGLLHWKGTQCPRGTARLRVWECLWGRRGALSLSGLLLQLPRLESVLPASHTAPQCPLLPAPRPSRNAKRQGQLSPNTSLATSGLRRLALPTVAVRGYRTAHVICPQRAQACANTGVPRYPGGMRPRTQLRYRHLWMLKSLIQNGSVFACNLGTSSLSHLYSTPSPSRPANAM